MAIPRFDPNTTAFKFNAVYDIEGENESSTFREIYIEGVWKYGTDIVFIERDSKVAEAVFVETLAEILTRGTPMRFFVEETDTWGGQGGMFAKFGLRLQNEMTAYCPKELFARTRPTEPDFFPKQGDLIYHVPANKLFEIKNISDDVNPGFYLFGNRVSFKFDCTAFSYEHVAVDQTVDNGIPDIIKQLDQPQENATDIANNTTTWVRFQEDSGILDNTERDALLK